MIQGLLIIVLMAGTFLLPMPVVALDEPLAYAEEQTIAPSLVRQGDFALQLAQSLKFSNVESEGEAIHALATLGIEPAGGWMSDYPMTPKIVVELRNAVVAAAAAVRLDMSLDAAMRVFTDLVGEFGLPLPVEPAPGYAGGGAPATASGPYCNGTALGYYYDNFGMPVYSYCPPPPVYLYLYSWVPCNFHWRGQVFTGFFIRRHIDGVAPHARHADTRHRFADDHAGKRHDHDDQRWREVQTSQSPPPRAIVGVGAAPSAVTPGADIIRRTRGHHVWTGAAASTTQSPGVLKPPAAVSIGKGAARLAPTAPTHNVRPFHETRGHALARITVAPAPAPAPPVAAVTGRHDMSRKISGRGASDSGATARVGGAASVNRNRLD